MQKLMNNPFRENLNSGIKPVKKTYFPSHIHSADRNEVPDPEINNYLKSADQIEADFLAAGGTPIAEEDSSVVLYMHSSIQEFSGFMEENY